MDYSSELKVIESAIAERTEKKNRLQGQLEAKKAELLALEAEIYNSLGCKPEEIVSKGESIKSSLEKNITEMKKILGLG